MYWHECEPWYQQSFSEGMVLLTMKPWYDVIYAHDSWSRIWIRSCTSWKPALLGQILYRAKLVYLQASTSWLNFIWEEVSNCSAMIHSTDLRPSSSVSKWLLSSKSCHRYPLILPDESTVYLVLLICWNLLLPAECSIFLLFLGIMTMDPYGWRWSRLATRRDNWHKVIHWKSNVYSLC